MPRNIVRSVNPLGKRLVSEYLVVVPQTGVAIRPVVEYSGEKSDRYYVSIKGQSMVVELLKNGPVPS